MVSRLCDEWYSRKTTSTDLEDYDVVLVNGFGVYAGSKLDVYKKRI
jgi:hypothetical protein